MAEPRFKPKQRVLCYQAIAGRSPPTKATVVWCRSQHAMVRVRGAGDHIVSIGSLTTR